MNNHNVASWMTVLRTRWCAVSLTHDAL